MNLDLALIGNCTVAALIDADARMLWACLPRFDSDAAFCALLREPARPDDRGYFSVELDDLAESQQSYLTNTPVLITTLHDGKGGTIEITDFAPRFRQFGRIFSPMSFVRTVRRVAGDPRIRVRLRPAADYGGRVPATTCGSNHVRYLLSDVVLRATTDCSITALVEELPFVLQGSVHFVLGPDETLQDAPADVARRFLDETVDFWRNWVRGLAIPFEWQDALIRAAITLELNTFEDTGAIIAAVTTSIPEFAGSTRNWDYRYCWLRDAYFVVNALNRLNSTRTMERYLAYIVNVASAADGHRLQPVYRINGRAEIPERELPQLPGFRAMGPVRVGNQAHLQRQHDVYGAVVLAATHMFFDRRLTRVGDEWLFARLEPLGEAAVRVYDQPDAGMWELRGSTRAHTFSSLMCWVACDRLAWIAGHLGLSERAAYWRGHADTMHTVIGTRAWNARRNSFVATFEGEALDASLLLLHELGFLAADDPRFAATVGAIERDLRRGDFLLRYAEPDDFGPPQNAFVICTYWYIDALHALGRRTDARALFETMLACRNRHGLLSEDLDPGTRELWGNFPQTYSMVGLINSAMLVSRPWESAMRWGPLAIARPKTH